MKYVLCFYLLLCCGCTSDNFYYEGDFLSVYKKAQSENKKLWVLFGGGDECISCNSILRDFKRNGTFKKYKGDYIFYKCNINEQKNKFMHYNLLMQEIPNSYIFDEKGVLVYASASDENAHKVEYALKRVLEGEKYYYNQNVFVTKKHSELLEMHNRTIKANIDYIEGKNNLEAINHSIAIEPYFYNLYLKYKIVSRMGLQNEADSCRILAREYSKLGWQAIVFRELYKELDAGLKIDSINQPKLKVLNTIDVGEFNCDAQNYLSVDIVNEGSKPLIIYHISTNCSCVITNFDKKPMMPQEKMTIKLIYQAVQKGNFIKKITIQSNAVNYIETVTIKGIGKK